MKSVSKSVAFLLIMLIGIVAGILLIDQTQEYREKAKQEEKIKYKICHKTGSTENPWVQIEVDESALKAHIDQGDIIGECPKLEELTSEPEPTSASGGQTEQPTVQPTSVTTEATPTTQTSQDTSSTQTSDDSGSQTTDSGSSQEQIAYVPETTKKPTYVGPTKLDFSIMFQSVNKAASDQKVKVTFKSQNDTHIYNDVLVKSDADGVFSATISDIKKGLFNIFIKTGSHLQRKFSDIKIVSGVNTWYWLNSKLIAGDFNDDNKLDLCDVALLLSAYNKNPTDVNEKNQKYDINFDGKIDLTDINIVVGNYTDFEILGDN